MLLHRIVRPEIQDLTRLALTLSQELARLFGEMCGCSLTFTREVALYEHIAGHIMNSRPKLLELMIIDGNIEGTNWIFVRDHDNAENRFKPATNGPNSRFVASL